MLRNFKSLLLLILIMFTFGFLYYSIDTFNTINKSINSRFILRAQPPNLDCLLSSIVTIHTKGKILAMNEEMDHEMFGTGVHIGNGYILTLTHCSEFPETVTVPLAPFAKTYVPITTLKENHYVNKQEIKLVGREGEISLFKMDSPPEIFIEIADEKDVIMGREVLLLCNEFAECYGVRIAYIYSETTGKVTMYKGEYIDDVFTIATTINPGSSGAPVLIFGEDNKPKVLGLLQSFLPGKELSFSLKPSYIKDCIKKIHKNTYNNVTLKDRG